LDPGDGPQSIRNASGPGGDSLNIAELMGRWKPLAGGPKAGAARGLQVLPDNVAFLNPRRIPQFGISAACGEFQVPFDAYKFAAHGSNARQWEHNKSVGTPRSRSEARHDF
jgi:hypothetical protein